MRKQILFPFVIIAGSLFALNVQAQEVKDPPPPPKVELVKFKAPPTAEEFYKKNPSVEDFYWQERGVLTLTLKTGAKEKYRINNKEEKMKFTKKYGAIPMVPPPPPPPSPKEKQRS